MQWECNKWHGAQSREGIGWEAVQGRNSSRANYDVATMVRRSLHQAALAGSRSLPRCPPGPHRLQGSRRHQVPVRRPPLFHSQPAAAEVGSMAGSYCNAWPLMQHGSSISQADAPGSHA